MITLRDFQARAVQRLRDGFCDLAKRALLLVSPTGSGKTFMFCAITQGAAERGNKTLILQHRRELIRQASLSLARLGVRHAIVAPPKTVEAIRRRHLKALGVSWIDADAPVAVGSIQTVTRRLAWLQAWAPVLIVLDEAHHALADTWSRILDAVPAARVLGVTATPIRLDGQGLGALFDELIEAATIPELIELGFLVPVRCWAPPCRADLSRVHLVGGDLDRDELTELLNRPAITGDAIEHYARLCPGSPALVYCCSIRHATDVCAAFNAAGFNFGLITGETPADERDGLIEGLEIGSLDGLVSVDVITEGLDIPRAVTCIMLRPTESEEKFLQMVGRVMRPHPGKAFGRLHDHVGNIDRHGKPSALRPWSLDGRPKRKRGDPPPAGLRLVQCPVCYFTADPRHVCGGQLADGSSCTHVFEPVGVTLRTVDGTLEELLEDPTPRPVPATAPARDYKSLRRAGCSHGRAMHILAARAERQALEARTLELLRAVQAIRPELTTRQIMGVTRGELSGLKPKQLKQLIQRLEADLEAETVPFTLEG